MGKGSFGRPSVPIQTKRASLDINEENGLLETSNHHEEVIETTKVPTVCHRGETTSDDHSQ